MGSVGPILPTCSLPWVAGVATAAVYDGQNDQARRHGNIFVAWCNYCLSSLTTTISTLFTASSSSHIKWYIICIQLKCVHTILYGFLAYICFRAKNQLTSRCAWLDLAYSAWHTPVPAPHKTPPH